MLAPSQSGKNDRAVNAERASLGLIAFACALAALILAFDMLVPLGVAGGVPYAGVVLISLWSRWRPLVFALAGLGTGLTVIGYHYSPAGGELWVVIANRGLAILVIWIAAIAALQRKRWESKLRESEAQMRLVTDALPVLIAYVDADRRFRFVNSTAEAWFAKPRANIIGRSIAEVVGEAQSERADLMLERVERGETFEMELAETYPDGVTRIVKMNFIPDFDADKKVRGHFALFQDVTEHKRAEARLRDSEARFRLLNENLPALVASMDSKFRYRFANRAYRDWFGLSDRDIVGKHVSAVLGQAAYRRLKPHLEASLSGKKVSFEASITRGDGAERTVAGTYIPDRDDVGIIQGLFLMADDITGRKRAEAALRESEARVDAFFTNAPIGLAIFDDQQRFLKINDVMAKWNGLTCEDHVGRKLAEIFPAYKKSSEISFDRIMKTGKSVLDVEFVAASPAEPDHEITWLINRFPIPGATGKPVGVGTVVMDVTEQKRASKEIYKLNAKLEQRVEKRTVELRNAQSELVRKERLATLGQLSATVSHELRNPLGTIRNSLVVLERKLDGNDLGVQRSLDRMVRNIKRCNKIIDEMLDFARGRDMEIKKATFDTWLESVLDELQAPPGVSVSRKFGAPEARAGIDDDRMRRAIINVYDNACQAMTGETGSKRPARKMKLAVSTKVANGRLELAIADTGPGMPPEVFAAAFEPLYSTKGFGVGLGLPIVKQIMEQHGGGIEITSEHGSGTRVVLWLPLEQNATKTKKEAKQ